LGMDNGFFRVIILIRTYVLIILTRMKLSMDLSKAGIALKCRCGATINTDMFGILFDDRGRVKISGNSLRCQTCGAIYRSGERLLYHLVRQENVLYSNGHGRS